MLIDMLEKLLERAFVLQQWHGQVAGMKKQAGAACAKTHRSAHRIALPLNTQLHRG